jgi:hypothetical protein
VAVRIVPANAEPPKAMRPTTAIAAAMSIFLFPTIVVSPYGRYRYAYGYTQRRDQRFTSNFLVILA